MHLLMLACTSSAPEVVDGMVAVDGGTVQLKTQSIGGPPPGANGAAPPLPPPPGMPGPPKPIQKPADPKPWAFYGGDGVQHEVRVDAFWLDQNEVTRRDYKAFVDATGYPAPHVAEAWADDGWNWVDGDPPEGTLDHPVVLVNWYDAKAYCGWVGKRLPTEAEWQLAALGDGEGRTYPWGQTYEAERLNHGMLEEPNFDASDGWERSSPVGSFPETRGFHDLFGNAWEFTSSWRVDDADNADQPLGLYVAVRGGSYFFDVQANPMGERNQFLPEIRRKTSGFRCARS